MLTDDICHDTIYPSHDISCNDTTTCDITCNDIIKAKMEEIVHIFPNSNSMK